MTTPGGPRQLGPRAALANRNYRLFLGGQAISQSGGWMQRIAQAWLVLEISDSPAVLGAVVTLQFLPILVLSLFAGALADRVPKRRALLVLEAFAIIQALTLALLTVTGAIELWHIYALALLLGVTNALEQPIRQAFPVELVGRELVSSAVALNSAVQNTARILGPALGGVVVVGLDVAGAFFLNGVSHLAIMAALLMMRHNDQVAEVSTRRGNTLTQIAESFVYVRGQPTLLFTFGVMTCLGIFGFNYSTFMPLLARYELGMGASGYGTLSVALGLGAICGALFVARRGYSSPLRQVWGGLAFSSILGCIALSPWLVSTLVLFAALGVAGVFFSTTGQTTLQLEAPDHMRGRIMGLSTLLGMGMTPPGATATGFLADLWGIRTALGIEAGVCIVGILIGWRYLAHTQARAHEQTTLTGVGSPSAAG